MNGSAFLMQSLLGIHLIIVKLSTTKANDSAQEKLR